MKHSQYYFSEIIGRNGYILSDTFGISRREMPQLSSRFALPQLELSATMPALALLESLNIWPLPLRISQNVSEK